MRFRDWLRAQLDEIGIDPTALSRLVNGLNQPTVQRILVSETGDPRIGTVEKIEQAVRIARQRAGLPPFDASSRAPLVDLDAHPDLVAVPRVRFKLSAGVSGYAIEPENGNGKPIFFRRDWFDTHNYQPDKLLSVRIAGASMEPSLWDGDLVVINTADIKPQDGECFAINFEGEMVIKRLRRDAGQWLATSDNADQRRYAPKHCTDDVKLIGRVIYKQSERI